MSSASPVPVVVPVTEANFALLKGMLFSDLHSYSAPNTYQVIGHTKKMWRIRPVPMKMTSLCPKTHAKTHMISKEWLDANPILQRSRGPVVKISLEGSIPRLNSKPRYTFSYKPVGYTGYYVQTTVDEVSESVPY